uniref:pentatricopeptide repeat-containing protein At5g61370, mitochondrial-like n=1 Tax=Erigeron canadensis TaxID=72917 RepID=UPI001CB8D794|nr:pentatricopeptide repeat-containing protein At5g61370, mitochondrial-like [Erigeron canadensis]
MKCLKECWIVWVILFKDMKALWQPKWGNFGMLNSRCFLLSNYSTSSDVEKLCDVVSHGVGSLDDLEASLDKLKVSCCSSVVTQVLDFSKRDAPVRRLLRFFSWSEKHVDVRLEDKDYNHAIRVFAEKKDFLALDMLISNIGKENRVMESSTFSIVAESLVKLGRVDEALGVFKNLAKLRCPQDCTTVTAIVSALCSKGHVKRAEGVIYHHKDKISSANLKHLIYRNLLHGWSMQENVKESRRILKDMKGAGISPDLFCYNTFLKCLCKKNLKYNPSGLVPEALNVMIEMRTYAIAPTTVSYNILLSCLGRTRRVKESLQILDTMRKAGCSPDWVSYYLVARVLYLTGRFGKGKQMVDQMIEDGLVPERKFYYDLIGILCGVERVNYALELFDLMKKSSLGGYETVYDLLIPKLCSTGEFEKGRELYEEAIAMGLTLECSSDVLNPLITKVFKPTRKLEDKICALDTPKQKTVGKLKFVTNLKKGKKLFIAKKNGKEMMVLKKVRRKGARPSP